MQTSSPLSTLFAATPSDNWEASPLTPLATVTIKSDLSNAFGILMHAEEQLEVTSDLIIARADLDALQQSLAPDNSEMSEMPSLSPIAKMRLWCWDDLDLQQKADLRASFADNPARFCDPHGFLAPRPPH